VEHTIKLGEEFSNKILIKFNNNIKKKELISKTLNLILTLKFFIPFLKAIEMLLKIN